MIEIPALWAIGATVFTGGVAFGGVKVALNGTKQRVEKIEANQDRNNDRLARIETKVDLLVDLMEKGHR